jgi:ABC-type dipeptide/oligopeptide/nickel transport system permease subunit
MESRRRNPSVDENPSYVGRSQAVEVWRRFRRSKSAVAGLVMLLTLILMAVFAEAIAPYDPIKQDHSNRMQPPSAKHILGTDELGRDIFSRIVFGARISVSVGLIAVTISCFGGVLLGSLAGYYGGRIDDVIMRIMDILMAIRAFSSTSRLWRPWGPVCRT